MKTIKLFRLFMAICISFSLIGATSIQAQENNIKISEDGFAIVYADLNNELEVKMEAQKAFDAGATVVKVENNAVKPRSSGWFQRNDSLLCCCWHWSRSCNKL